MGVEPNTWKSWELESSGTPECLELDSKRQNTSNWGVLSVVGKVLKRKYRKCPRINNLHSCSPSYGQKKGRELNWQFDSRPLKVRNRPPPDVRFGSATWRWKGLDNGYNFGSDPCCDSTLQSGVMAVQSSGSPIGTNSRLPKPGNLCHLDAPSVASCIKYYRE